MKLSSLTSRTQFLVPVAMVSVLLWASATQAAEENSDDRNAKPSTAIATFAGGCFWCMEPPFDKMTGVLSTTSGYTGGRTPNPTYEAVKTGRTGHIESMQIVYDPSKVSYEQLLGLYWHNVDPIKANGQFCDEGGQYRTAIFYHDDEQKQAAEASKKATAKTLRARVRTEIIEATKFYPAEDYHQDYYTKNPTKYKFYRWTCGRDARLDALWGDKARKP
ncbi:Peptide methionine sulfoxide reductase MsrA [Rubripirellula lacrimiformis]|uniref:Peptide methionine sulfoxide reductase MsrA n=1 Tax=Rubripirellula lacrimiformis TaxID=1930273 RepID=A0A517NL85_9BACT|nr:peptide-methionine (S)-S-oxide reductase MsrA [Rubripirellula lacrimiformis]QDT07839.1 Peptide methionine sulfoxide reductase MsrA [Rubripirellula lacrimiformis]